MKDRYLRVLSLMCALVMLLCGCSGSVADMIEQGEMLWNAATQVQPEQAQDGDTSAQEDEVPPRNAAFSQMEYSRPDMQVLEDVLQESCQIAREETDARKTMEAVYDYYDVYDRFYTDLALADIHYSCDLTDTYWQEEYDFCLEQVGTVDAGLEELYYALAESPIRKELEEDYFGEGYFDSYDGESVYSQEFLALMEQEAQLQSKYQQLMAGYSYSEEFLDQNAVEMTQILVDLVQVRQQMAQEAGYDSYPDFAYDFYHYRDYTAEQAENYMKEIPVVLDDLYRAVNQSRIWELGYDYCSEEDTFAYVQTAAKNMGRTTARAFAELEDRELCHIGYGLNKAEGAYEVYLWSYTSPFIYMSPYQDQTDKLSFAHEFGHFLNDYTSKGSYVGTDISEIQSQGFEYLSLFYGENTEDLEKYKLADSLLTYVEQAAYGLFEQQLYQLEGSQLTVENVMVLYESIGLAFGFDSWNWDSRDFVLISHFYTDPMYIISYVVSNDVAFQIYQMEKAAAGTGLKTYEACVKSQDSYLLWFTEEYGLESPFVPGRLEQVRATLEEGLADYL